jgi:hypothetical protein
MELQESVRAAEADFWRSIDVRVSGVLYKNPHHFFLRLGGTPRKNILRADRRSVKTSSSAQREVVPAFCLRPLGKVQGHNAPYIGKHYFSPFSPSRILESKCVPLFGYERNTTKPFYLHGVLFVCDILFIRVYRNAIYAVAL